MHEAEGERESQGSHDWVQGAGGDGVAWRGGVGEATRRSQASVGCVEFLPYRLQDRYRCRYRCSSARAVTRGRKVTRGGDGHRGP